MSLITFKEINALYRRRGYYFLRAVCIYLESPQTSKPRTQAACGRRNEPGDEDSRHQ